MPFVGDGSTSSPTTCAAAAVSKKRTINFPAAAVQSVRCFTVYIL